VAGPGGRLGRTAVEDCVRFGREAAEAAIPLPKLLDLYLSATWRLWADLIGGARERPLPDIPSAAAALLRAADDAAAALARGYDTAQRQAIRREEAVRREFVDDLLAGRTGSEAFRDHARRLGFNLAGAHRAMVASSPGPLEDAGPVQMRVESSLVAAAGTADGFVTTKEGLLVCVVPAAAAVTGDDLLGHLRAAGPGPWSVGVGRAASGGAGVAQSYAEAREALGFRARLRLPDPVVAFSSLLPLRLLTQHEAALKEAVDSVLGPLGAARGGAEPLIDTLEAYFDVGLSATEAARRLHLSVRTVTYRLERVSVLTGRSVRDANDRFALEIAVRGHRLLTTDVAAGAP
jgi:DNA-binding PucR family transcriptional regulator